MTTAASLSASLRTDTGKGVARTLRREGSIPGVIYGNKRAPQPLAVKASELDRLLSRISAENTVISLDLGGTGTRALIREIQRHPFKRQILHIDFQEIVAGEKVTVKVPVTLVGTPVGVRLNGGMLEHVLREITLLIDPANIPNHLEVDVSELDLGQIAHVSNIVVPAGAEVLDDPQGAVAVVGTPRAAKEAANEEGEGSAEPEVIRAKKPDDDASA